MNLIIGSKAFQRKFAQILIENKLSELVIYCAEEYFDLIVLRSLITAIKDYYEKYTAIPTREYLKDIVAPDIKDDTIKNGVIEYLNSWEELALDEVEAIKSTAIEFFKKQSLKNTIINIAERLPHEAFATLESDLYKSMADLNFSNDYIDTAKDIDSYINIPRITTPSGLGIIDGEEFLNGGLGVGEMGIALGGIGGSKSHFLVDRACTALRFHKGVKDAIVYFTCELADNVIATRAVSNLTDIPYTPLKKEYERYRDKVKEILSTIKPRLFVKEYPSNTATVAMFRSYLDNIRGQGYNIKLICVDYPDEMKTNIKGDTSRFVLANIFRDLRTLSHKKNYGCPLWTCSQVNRAGNSKDIITLSEISECFTKGAIADIALSINSEKIILLKNRAGKDKYIFPCSINTSTSSFMVSPNPPQPLKDYMDKNKMSEKDLETAIKQNYKKIYGKDLPDIDILGEEAPDSKNVIPFKNNEDTDK